MRPVESSAPVGPAIALSSLVPPEIAVAAEPDDERVWVPQAPHVWFRPLMFNTVTGQWCNLLKVTASGVVSRHRHPGVVFGYVIKGTWHYHEHDWVAEAGHFVYEPPGEIHTLAVPENCTEMITFFNITGAMAYVDDNGVQIGYEDTFTKIDMCRAHYEKVGLGADYVNQFVR
ncbi:2,4'-dihydroxyacetophenone dioxygenase family protein [Streptomyces sp. Je 1-332]|uniref:2,4'-dihydroxyacetophenone dioxygenase family protein n=1 Tax=Streptomyces sp. Je 1-332 TaxID=3231270 RepID=UPI003458766C